MAKNRHGKYYIRKAWKPKLIAIAELMELPKSAEMIEQFIGRNAVILLAEKSPYRTRDKCQIYIPKSYKPGHWIRRAIGDKLFEIMRLEFGGELLEIATCKAVREAPRNRDMITANIKGMNLRAIAEKYRLCHRWVRIIINRSIVTGEYSFIEAELNNKPTAGLLKSGLSNIKELLGYSQPGANILKEMHCEIQSIRSERGEVCYF